MQIPKTDADCAAFMKKIEKYSSKRNGK